MWVAAAGGCGVVLLLPLTFALSSLVEEVYTRINISNVTILKIHIHIYIFFLVPSMCPNASRSQEFRLENRAGKKNSVRHGLVCGLDMD